MNDHGEPEVWLAYSEPDKAQARFLSEGLDRQLISVLNDYVEYRLRSGEDELDVVTQSISRSDHVIIMLSPNSNLEDLISQIKRARSLNKPQTVLITSDQVSPLPLAASGELIELISGLPHIYLAAKRTFVDLVKRIQTKPAAPPSTPIIQTSQDTKHYSVFISKKSQDYTFARRVYDLLLSKGISVFLSEESLPNLGNTEYMKAIDRALEQAEHLIVVGSKPEYLLSGWVEAEWRVFINEKRSGRKSGNVVTLIADGMTPGSLPMSLRYYEVLPLTDEGLAKLLHFVTDK